MNNPAGVGVVVVVVIVVVVVFAVVVVGFVFKVEKKRVDIEVLSDCSHNIS